MNPAMFLNLSLWFILLTLVGGCGGKVDPYGRQVRRALETALQGQELYQEGDYLRAGRSWQKALQLSQSIDHQPGVAQSLNNLGALALEQGKLAAAREFFTQALAINQELGDFRELAVNLANLATVAQKAGNLPEAEAYLHRARQAAAVTSDTRLQARLQVQEAGLALDRGDLAGAASLLASLTPAALGADQGAWHYQQGRLALAQGDPLQAWNHFAAALAADRWQLRHTAMAADLLGQTEAALALKDHGRAFAALKRATQIYLALRQLEPARRCLARLRQLKETGRLPESLALYEAQLKDLEALNPGTGTAAAPERTGAVPPPPGSR